MFAAKYARLNCRIPGHFKAIPLKQWLRGYAATRLRGYEATRLRGYAATRLRGYAATRLRGYVATRLRGYVGTGLLRIAGHFDGPSICLFPCFQFSICFEIPITRTLFDFFIRFPSRESFIGFYILNYPISLVSISDTILSSLRS